MEERQVRVPCGDLLLEGRLAYGSGFGALLCHPHPLYGGCMEDYVVMTGWKALVALGGSVLRFNFRGVGSSQGEPGEGEGEVEDVRAAMRFLQTEARCTPSRTLLLGYSFGAWVGLRALALESEILGWVTLAPPVAVWDLSFASLLGGRKLVVAGDRDPLCGHEPLARFVACLSEPKETVILSGADHFFRGWESKLRELIQNRVASWVH